MGVMPSGVKMATDREDQKKDPETIEDQGQAGESPETSAPVTLETLQTLIEEKEKHIRALNKESAERRRKLEAFEKEQADKQAAEMSDLEKEKKRSADLESQINDLMKQNHDLKTRQVFQSQARKMNVAFVNETARDDAFGFLDLDTVGDDLSGMESAIKDLIKSRPYLFGSEETQRSQNDGGKKSSASLGQMTQQELINKKRKSYAPL
jgi:predicted  nucleic acid-binding Zn-ribbon protein